MGWAAAITAGVNFISNERTNSASRKESSANRAFQEQMSNTAHRREVEDLREAGLNPILSAKFNGASTPGGSMATMQNAMPAGIATALQAYKVSEEMKNLKADTFKKKEEAHGIAAQAQKATAEREAAKQYEKLLNEQTKSSAYGNVRQKQDAKFYESEFGKAMRNIGRFRDEFSGILPFTSGYSAKQGASIRSK